MSKHSRVIEEIMNIVGPVQPTGDNKEDGSRYKNQDVLADIVNDLIREMVDIAKYKGRRSENTEKMMKMAMDDLLTLLDFIEYELDLD